MKYKDAIIFKGNFYQKPIFRAGMVGFTPYNTYP